MNLKIAFVGIFVNITIFLKKFFFFLLILEQKNAKSQGIKYPTLGLSYTRLFLVREYYFKCSTIKSIIAQTLEIIVAMLTTQAPISQ
ncbi:hypothetical protein cco79_07350 [Campylobacter coli LMG 23344]|nr:hypothetical protein cco79_07350 [Campylobacter coli LMG 23344]